MSIEITGIEKSFKQYEALKGINLNINQGELVALLGPSGSGKTTLLRIIAGLEYQDKGRVLINKELLSDKPAEDRSIGFVFQHYALFRHMSVFENVAFGMRVAKKDKRRSEQEINEKVSELLRLVQIEKFYDHYPNQLSGGQRQRVALARSLAVEPEILLLDEPFGALDAKVRKDLRRWLRKLHETMNITSIFVTHDQEEAMEVADRVVILNDGIIEQVGSPEEVYQNPGNSFVYDFLGNFNVFEGYKDDKGEVHIAEYMRSENADNEMKKQPETSLVDSAKSLVKGLFTNRKTYKLVSRRRNFVRKDCPGKQVQIFARPHELNISKDAEKASIPCVVSHINAAGSLVKVELEREANGSVLQAEITREVFEGLAVDKKDKVYVTLLNKTVFE